MNQSPLETVSSDQLRNWLDGSADIDLGTLRKLAKHAINDELRERYNRVPRSMCGGGMLLRNSRHADAEPRVFEYISDGDTITL